MGSEVSEWVTFLVDLVMNAAKYWGYVSSILVALSAIAMAIPGSFPDKYFKMASDWVAKHSAK